MQSCCPVTGNFHREMLLKFLVLAAAVGLLLMQGGNFHCNVLAYLCNLCQLKFFYEIFFSWRRRYANTYYLQTICCTLAMLLPSLFMFFKTYLLTGNCQCYTDTVCAGDTINVTEAGLQIAVQADCCVGTNAGLSYNGGSSCNLCIGMSVRYLQWVTALFQFMGLRKLHMMWWRMNGWTQCFNSMWREWHSLLVLLSLESSPPQQMALQVSCSPKR